MMRKRHRRHRFPITKTLSAADATDFHRNLLTFEEALVFMRRLAVLRLLHPTTTAERDRIRI